MINLDYLYDSAAAKSFSDKKRFIDKKLGFQVIERGTILPYKKTIDGKGTADYWGFGGIVDNEGKFIKSSHVACGFGSYYPPPLH